LILFDSLIDADLPTERQIARIDAIRRSNRFDVGLQRAGPDQQGE
jgi:hypothetical protein